MKWLKITYNYCLTVSAGWWSRLGLAVSSASGCHRLQWRCRLRLGSHLRPDWGGIFFQVPMCCQDSAPRGLWGLGPRSSAGCESAATLGSLPRGPVQQVGCFIKACIWEGNSLLVRQKSVFSNNHNCLMLSCWTKRSKGRWRHRPRTQEQGSLGAVLEAAPECHQEDTLLQLHHNLKHPEHSRI